MKRLAIVITHPIQYNAPFFKLLAERKNIDVKIFYTWPQAIEGFEDNGFKRKIQWDIPLLEGYPYELIENTAKIPSSKSFSGIVNPTLINKVSSYHPDAILVFGWNFKSHLSLIRHFKGKIPIWFRGDSTLLDEKKGSIKSLIRRLWLSFIYHHIDKAFYVGEENKRYFAKHSLQENELVFAPHAIDNERFHIAKDNQLIFEWKELFKIERNEQIVLFAGKFEHKKNPMGLLKAFQMLHLKHVHLIFVGNGPLELELMEEARGFSNIHFLPFQNQSRMPSIYWLADLVVLPSVGPGETWGLTINEAMACAKAVLVSDKVGCYKNLVVEGENGFVFNSNDNKDLGINLFKLLSECDLKKMGERSYQIIQFFSFEYICKAIELELDNLG